jgi:hypothetical protein
VLARLAPHFHLDLKKKMFRSRFRFYACNLNEMQQLSRSDLDALQRSATGTENSCCGGRHLAGKLIVRRVLVLSSCRQTCGR